jgi:hypothetical protein
MSTKIANNYTDALVTWIESKLHVMNNPPTIEEVGEMNNSQLENLADRIDKILN